MLYIENGEWSLCPYKVVYKQRGEKLEQYTHDKKWWKDFADKWNHTEIIEFEDISWSDKQKNRLKEVQHIGEGFSFFVENYVKDGLFPDELEDEEERMGNHPMKTLQNKKESESHGQAITEEQLSNMDLGRKQTDMELRIMQLESEAE